MRFLKSNNTQLNYQTIAGRVTDSEVKKRISDGLKNSSVRFQLICNQCGTNFESKSFHRKRCIDCISEIRPVIPKNAKERERVPREYKKPETTNKFLIICMQCSSNFESLSLNSKYCSYKCSGESNRKALPPIEVIEKLYWEEKISANKIGDMYSVSGQTIRNYMRANGLDRREERHRS